MKKNPAEFEKLEEEYYQNIKDKNLSYNLCNYVWRVLVCMSKGYGFKVLNPYIVIYSKKSFKLRGTPKVLITKLNQ